MTGAGRRERGWGQRGEDGVLSKDGISSCSRHISDGRIGGAWGARPDALEAAQIMVLGVNEALGVNDLGLRCEMDLQKA